MTIQELLSDEAFWKVQSNELGAKLLDLVNGPSTVESFRECVHFFIQQLMGNIDWFDKGSPKFGTPEYFERIREVFYTGVGQQ